MGFDFHQFISFIKCDVQDYFLIFCLCFICSWINASRHSSRPLWGWTDISFSSCWLPSWMKYCSQQSWRPSVWSQINLLDLPGKLQDKQVFYKKWGTHRVKVECCGQTGLVVLRQVEKEKDSFKQNISLTLLPLGTNNKRFDLRKTPYKKGKALLQYVVDPWTWSRMLFTWDTLAFLMLIGVCWTPFSPNSSTTSIGS